MNLIRCENGHFYDKEKYASCPYCAGDAAADEGLTSVFTEETDSSPVSDTMPLDAVITPSPAPMPEPVPAAGIGYGPVGSEISSEEDDQTVAFYDAMFPPATTAAAVSAASGAPANRINSPCVGWLVALGGAHIGEDFHLKAGKNFIGRGLQMDVVLAGDKSVSRNRHAIVVYEPKQHLYLIQPGESSGLVYRNNEVVLGPLKLEAYDVITVGDIELLFMPLCGGRFNWSERLEKISKKNQN